MCDPYSPTSTSFTETISEYLTNMCRKILECVLSLKGGALVNFMLISQFFCETVFVTNNVGFSHKLLPYLMTNQTLELVERNRHNIFGLNSFLKLALK